MKEGKNVKSGGKGQPMAAAVAVEGLTKSYHRVKALENFTLTVDHGEVFGLLGANGAGKSTAIECILGTKMKDSGKVSVLGMDPEKDRKALFERVGVQFQDSCYQEKITVGELCEVTESLYQSALKPLPLLQRFGLGDKVKRPVSELSGGQRQRLFIVLALIPGPELVFLDELTTGLDPRARRDVWKCLGDLKAKGMTIVMTSHFMDEVEALCDRIMILKQGRQIFLGTVQEAVEESPWEDFEDAYLWFTDEAPEDGHGVGEWLLGNNSNETEKEEKWNERL